MSWDKYHIERIEKDFKRVKELGDEIGYLFLVQSALAIYKHNAKQDFPANYLSLSDEDIKDYDELIQKINTNK